MSPRLFFALWLMLTYDNQVLGTSQPNRVRKFSGAPIFLELYDAKSNNYSRALCGSHVLSKVARSHHPHLARYCNESPTTAEVIHAASLEAIHECRNHFRNKRWNCEFAKHFLYSGTKHAGLVWALVTGHALTALVRSCSRGHLTDCTCDNYAPESRRIASFADVNRPAGPMRKTETVAATRGDFGQNSILERRKKSSTVDEDSQKTFSRQGCEINQVVRHGLKSIRRYFNDVKASKVRMNLSELVNNHNRRVGLYIVRRKRKTYCRCHGLSGSCTSKVCFRDLSEVGKAYPMFHILFNNAKRVVPARNVNGKVRIPLQLRLYRRPGKLNNALDLAKPQRIDLVYNIYSPDYCAPKMDIGWPGVAQRLCNITGIEDEECRDVCCTDSFEVLSQEKNVRKNCRFEREGFKVHCTTEKQMINVGRCPHESYYRIKSTIKSGKMKLLKVIRQKR